MEKTVLTTGLPQKDICFYDAEQSPFQITGVFREGNSFTRLPEAVAKTVNDGVVGLRLHTAGGRLRFRTDSTYVAIKVFRSKPGKMSHMPLTGIAGFDLYTADGNGKGLYRGTFIPPEAEEGGYESVVFLEEPGVKECTVNFPLYSGFDRLYIGLSEGAAVEAPSTFTTEYPVVFYGSSITQGGCASRPGTCYQNIIAMRTGINYVNLGFSGSGRGEDTIVDYMAAMEMSCFVMDYDHNAPDATHLKTTHEKMYKAIRLAHPDIPIIMISRPQGHPSPEGLKRKAIIEETWRNALASGDTNVAFVDGMAFFEGDKAELAQVDGCHPNDIGFFCMADKIGEAICSLLKL